MAICDSQTLIADGACFACLDAKQLQMAKLALLCRILQFLDPMATCDPQALVADGACFACLDARQMQIVELQFLCNIAGESGGGGGIGGVTSGVGAPVAPPVSGNGFYLDTSNGDVWAWNSVLGIWIQIIA